MKKIFVLLAGLGLIAVASAHQPGSVSRVLACPTTPTTFVEVRFLPYGMTWVTDSLVAKDSAKCGWTDTLTVQIPVGVDYKGISFTPKYVKGDSDSVRITARAILRTDLLACAAGSKMQVVPLVDANGTAQEWLEWTSNHEYQSFVPDSNTAVEEFRPPACEAIQFVIQSGITHADTLVFTFGVVFKAGGGM